MNIMWDNLIDNGTVTASSHATNFPITNIQQIHLSSIWKSDLEVEPTIVFDLGQEYGISNICIGGHNLSHTATITLEANTTDDWTTPAFSEVVTWRNNLLIHYLSSTQTYRYWRLVISDVGNVDNYISIGRVFLGTFLEMPPIEPDYSIAINSTSSRKTSISGQVYSDNGYTYKSLDFNFPLITEAERQDIMTMYEGVNISIPVFIDTFSETPDLVVPFYGVIDTSSVVWNKRLTDGLYWSTSFTFSEVQ